jgi:hypothetical protein
MSAHEGESNHDSAAQVFSDEGVHSVTVLKTVKQRRQAFGWSFKGNIASCTRARALRLVSASTLAWAILSCRSVSFIALDRSAQKLSATELASV